MVEGDPAWREGLTVRYQAFNTVHGRPENAPVPAEERTRIRTELATEMFTERHGRPPAHTGELTGFLAQVSRPESASVAGFDLTFSPVKSVSALWAVAPRPVAEQIEAAHDAAVTQDHGLPGIRGRVHPDGQPTGCGRSRSAGLVAAMFTHRDSRAGDPDLHTHVAVSNKVQTLDGRWLALDGRMLYRFNVAASEFYNSQLEAEVTTRIGGTFLAKERGGRETAGAGTGRRRRPAHRALVPPPGSHRDGHRGPRRAVRDPAGPGADRGGNPAAGAAGHPGNPGTPNTNPGP